VLLRCAACAACATRSRTGFSDSMALQLVGETQHTQCPRSGCLGLSWACPVLLSAHFSSSSFSESSPTYPSASVTLHSPQPTDGRFGMKPPHAPACSFTHSLIHAFTHSRIHAFTHSRIPAFTLHTATAAKYHNRAEDYYRSRDDNIRV